MDISYKNTIQFIRNDAYPGRINLINQRLEHLISTITGAETGHRGFMIANRPDYLEPYNSAVNNIDLQPGEVLTD
ncbi:MAG TPA: CHASE3 domain-containing protein [Candidatus Bathyarchaeia archaeon]|nr:CHASE3 domain-containing protein [Candidatus Bathyarchaeia archaeon]